MAAKRAFDVLLATAMLLAVLPVMLLIALAIKLDSPGPVLFRVRRVGFRGEPLDMLKFRKMHHDAVGGPLTTSDDPRLTRIGALLTRTRLDELPQLWDVMQGRMSIVGPRPEHPEFVALHPREYRQILSVRPGITGVSQLAFAQERDILDAVDPVADYRLRILPEKVKLDSLYAERHRIALDLTVLWWTVLAVVMQRSIAVDRQTFRLSVRKRPPQHGAGIDAAAEPISIGSVESAAAAVTELA